MTPDVRLAVARVDVAAAARLRRYAAAHPGQRSAAVGFALDGANQVVDAFEAGRMTEPQCVARLDDIAAALDGTK